MDLLKSTLRLGPERPPPPDRILRTLPMTSAGLASASHELMLDHLVDLTGGRTSSISPMRRSR